MSHYNKNYFGVLLVKSAQLGFRSSQESNINREAPPSFVLTSLKQVHWREKKKCATEREEKLSWGFTLSWLSSVLRNFCGVLSLVVSLRKISMFFVLLCLFLFQ